MTDEAVLGEAVYALRRLVRDCESDLRRFKDEHTQKECTKSLARYEYAIARLYAMSADLAVRRANAALGNP